MSISLKEANETDYWIDLLYKSEFIDNKTFNEFKPKSEEMIKLLVSIVKTSKQ